MKMSRKIGRYVLLALSFFTLTSAAAQDINFYASVDKNPVPLDESFSYTVTLENAQGNILPPDLSDFQVVFGPSRSSSYRIVNGSQTSSLALTYSLRPVREGEFTIPPARVSIGGRELRTDAIAIKVVKGQSGGRGAGGASNRSDATETISSDQNIIARIQLSKNQAYVGEQLTATYLLLTRYSNLELASTSFPTLTGFWAETVADKETSWDRDYEFINGVPYRKAVLKTQVLFPQRSGQLTIPAMELSCIANRGFFNPGTTVEVRSNAPQVDVQALPAGAPASFDGAVGEFSLDVETNKLEAKTNEALELSITIAGSGNLMLLTPPTVSFPEEFEVYDPEINDRLRTSASGVSGARTYQYLIIPRFPGSFTIPAIQFSYFNPRTEKYVVLSKDSIQFAITGEAGLGASSDGGMLKRRVSPGGSEIRYIVTDSDTLVDEQNHFFGSLSFYLFLAAPFLGLVFFLGLYQRHHALKSDAVRLRQSRANKMATRRLKAAAKAMQAGNSKDFYAEIFKALSGYLSDKLSIPVGELSKKNISAALQERAVSAPLREEVLSSLELCEAARFAPQSTSSDQSFYKKTLTLIASIESQLK